MAIKKTKKHVPKVVPTHSVTTRSVTTRSASTRSASTRSVTTYVKSELCSMLDDMILLALDGIIKYDKNGFNMNRACNISDLSQTPTSFQERFIILMDIIEPAQKYALNFIRRKHPEAEYLFNFFVSLYNDEVQIKSSKRGSPEE